MEYKRESCVDKKGTKCKFCDDTDWKGIPMERISRPWPDYTKLPDFHYKPFSETPGTDELGNLRRPDDFQPRANLKAMFEEDSISLDDADSIERFSKKFIVAENLTRDYLEHLQNLKRMKVIRTREKQKQRDQIQAKGYHDYNWEELVEERTIGKLLVKELDKYLDHNNLPMTGKKKEKVRRIVAHLYTQLDKDRNAHEGRFEITSESESEVEDVRSTIDTASGSDSDSSHSEDLDPHAESQFRTRAGRLATRKTWDDYIVY